MKIAIGLPINGWMPAQALASFIPLITTTMLNRQLLDVYMSSHNLLSMARQVICDLALKDGATHLLFVDSDIITPPDLAQRLMRHAKPVVSALYYARTDPWNPVAAEHPVPGGFEAISHEVAAQPGLMRVWCVGFGACLIHADVLRHLSKSGPLFEFACREGEDMYFARRCEAADIGIWLDRDTVCGHVGTQIVNASTAGKFQ